MVPDDVENVEKRRGTRKADSANEAHQLEQVAAEANAFEPGVVEIDDDPGLLVLFQDAQGEVTFDVRDAVSCREDVVRAGEVGDSLRVSADSVGDEEDIDTFLFDRVCDRVA